MRRGTNKLAACLIAACLFCAVAANASVDTAPEKGATTYGLSTVTSGDMTLQVPVIRQTTPREDGTVTTTVQVLVPDMTEDALEQNADYVEQIRAKGRFAPAPGNGGVSTFADPGFITYTTTLVYNVQTGQNDFRKYDLISFRLDREIYTMAPYDSVHKATVRVDQTGFSDPSQDSGQMVEQTKDLGEIEYGKTYGKGSDWPEDWQALGTASGSPQIGITYDVLLDYADGTSRTLSFTHTAH